MQSVAHVHDLFHGMLTLDFLHYVGSGMGHLFTTGPIPDWIFELPELRIA